MDESFEAAAARYGVSTMYDAAGRSALIDLSYDLDGLRARAKARKGARIGPPLGNEACMHNEDIERPTDRSEDLREAVVAADDTGLVSQQEILTVAELGDAPAAGESEV